MRYRDLIPEVSRRYLLDIKGRSSRGTSRNEVHDRKEADRPPEGDPRVVEERIWCARSMGKHLGAPTRPVPEVSIMR